MLVRIVPPDPTWPQQFVIAAAEVQATLGDAIAAIYHIGSTAIPQVYAKPILDLLVEARDLVQVDQRVAEMAAIAYEAMGEFGIPGRRFFRRHNADGIRTHHVHIFPTGHPDIARHLNFRDYLTAHPHLAQQYTDLKRQLADQFPTDIDQYMDGKDGFIKAMDQQAALWRSRLPQN